MSQSFLNSDIGFINQVQRERARQILQEGFTAEHDDEHTHGEISYAAACYALPPSMHRDEELINRLWPWNLSWWKPAAIPYRPQDRQRELIKAAALLYAEWDRLERHIIRINEAPADTLAAAAITEPEDFPPLSVCRDNLTPFEWAIKEAAEKKLTNELNKHPYLMQYISRCSLCKGVGYVTDIDPKILPLEPGEPGYGGYDPNNPPPDTAGPNFKPDKSYPERVQAIAEKMAKDDLNSESLNKIVNGTASDVLKTFYDSQIEANKNKARIAVAEMAEAYKAGWCEIYDFSNDPEFGPDIQKGLIRLGLIPDNGQEAGRDGKE